MSDSLWLHGLELTNLLCPWNSPGKNTGVDCYSLLQGIFPTLGSNPGLLHCRQILYHLSHRGGPKMYYFKVSFALTYFHVSKDSIDKEILDIYCFLVLLSIKQSLKWSEVKSLGYVRLFVTPWAVAYQASLSMGLSRQEYWSRLPFPSPGDLPNLGIPTQSKIKTIKKNQT